MAELAGQGAFKFEFKPADLEFGLSVVQLVLEGVRVVRLAPCVSRAHSAEGQGEGEK